MIGQIVIKYGLKHFFKENYESLHFLVAWHSYMIFLSIIGIIRYWESTWYVLGYGIVPCINLSILISTIQSKGDFFKEDEK